MATQKLENSMANNLNFLNIKQEKNLCTNARESNSSDQAESKIVFTAPHTCIPMATQKQENSMANNLNFLNIKQEKNLCTNARESNSSDQAESKIVLTAPHTFIPMATQKQENSMANNLNFLNIKQEKNLCTNARESNSSDQAESKIVLTAPHTCIPMATQKLENSMANNLNFLNIKQEKNLFTNARESNSSDQAESVNNNESTLANEPRELMAEQNPINIANNNIVSIVRETPYLCIRKLPNIKNGFCHDDNDQDNIIFICRICKDSTSSDIHSFALHMSVHKECNMHECIVCDKTFNSVILWVDHMTYHQQQIDLNYVSTIPFDPMDNESNALDPIKSRTMEPQHKNKLSVPVNYKNNNMNNNHVNKNNEKKSTFCIICNKHFAHRGALTNHMRIHGCATYKCLWFPCDVCEKKFANPVELNVHRKSHSGIVPYVCKICNKTYQLKFRWNCHLKSHYKKHNSNLKSKQHNNNLKSNITKRKIESISHKDKMKCRYCKKEYNLISQWKRHMTMSKECRRHCKSNIPEFTSNKAANNSTKSGLFSCNICMETYRTTYNLAVHKKYIHKVLDSTYLNTYDNTGLQKDKLTDIQEKPAIKKRNRRNHINSIKCELCGKTYSNRGNLSRHISMIHTQNLETLTCNACGRTFKHKYSYREHLRIKHKQLFKQNGGKNSTCKKTRRQIMSVNKKNTMKYFCKVCEMKFADNITLQEHSKIHTLNMFKCKDCGQQFETILNLGNHILKDMCCASTSTSNNN